VNQSGSIYIFLPRWPPGISKCGHFDSTGECPLRQNIHTFVLEDLSYLTVLMLSHPSSPPLWLLSRQLSAQPTLQEPPRYPLRSYSAARRAFASIATRVLSHSVVSIVDRGDQICLRAVSDHIRFHLTLYILSLLHVMLPRLGLIVCVGSRTLQKRPLPRPASAGTRHTGPWQP